MVEDSHNRVELSNHWIDDSFENSYNLLSTSMLAHINMIRIQSSMRWLVRIALIRGI